MKYALVDTGVWLARFDDNDRRHDDAVAALNSIQESPVNILAPWPILYETLRTRFVKKEASLRQFGSVIKSPNVARVDDSPYREEALTITLKQQRQFPEMSMADCLLVLMMQDGAFRIRHFVTFDGGGHFRRICAEKKINILPRRMI